MARNGRAPSSPDPGHRHHHNPPRQTGLDVRLTPEGEKSPLATVVQGVACPVRGCPWTGTCPLHLETELEDGRVAALVRARPDGGVR